MCSLYKEWVRGELLYMLTLVVSVFKPILSALGWTDDFLHSRLEGRSLKERWMLSGFCWVGVPLCFCRDLELLCATLTDLSECFVYTEVFWICYRASVQNSYRRTSCSAIALLQVPHMRAASFQNAHAFFDFVQAVLEGGTNWSGKEKFSVFPKVNWSALGIFFTDVCLLKLLPGRADPKLCSWMWQPGIFAVHFMLAQHS